MRSRRDTSWACSQPRSQPLTAPPPHSLVECGGAVSESGSHRHPPFNMAVPIPQRARHDLFQSYNLHTDVKFEVHTIEERPVTRPSLRSAWLMVIFLARTCRSSARIPWTGRATGTCPAVSCQPTTRSTAERSRRWHPS